jgi:mRNA degradation ribonuclease J1/J2
LKENQELLHQVRIIIKKSVEDSTAKLMARSGSNVQMDFDQIKGALGENISKFLYQKTAKRPLIIPVILSV